MKTSLKTLLAVALGWVTANVAMAANGNAEVYVADMAQLRAAIDQGNDGDTVVLAAGTYLVDAPLVLKPHMRLVGQNRYVQLSDGSRELIPETATILDGSQLASGPLTVISDCETPPGTFTPPRAIIEEAGFDNAISSISVRFAFGIGIRQPIAAAPGSSLSLTIADCVFENCRLGIAFNNSGCSMYGAKASLKVERCIFNNNQRGIAIINLLASGATTDASLIDNLFSQNTVAGLQIGGGSYGTDDSTMRVTSAGNRFELNAAGALLMNGWHGATGRKASDRNQLVLISQRDVYVGNSYGVRVQSALITFNDSVPSSGNSTRVDILAGTFVGNTDHLAATAWTDLRPGGGPVGTDNTVELLIRHTTSSADAKFALCSGSPSEPSNRVTLIGPATAVESANDGVLVEECP
jgi:hypothetical protein